ncbi:uncharacterized protein LOC112184376 isoform X3 [Rosa chinensis]|uniref:uncharacterized protein LOC112184376 isoform X3 n=1 Tax=Rosa chinensis TaxID=74649 RepID=UPI000D08C2AE|nr:uncharacterized protein LOC112184376 isoform X3 [Rosa chinensis]XP_040368476.1 uncharacterized protein LOC112184376 isoform X3 [Rosa chinensis]
MSLIKKPERDGVAVNRGDGRDGVVSAGQEECVQPAPFGPLPKGYVWDRLYVSTSGVGRPLCAAPMFCVICSKLLEHMTKDCPHLHDESYSDRRWKVFHAPLVVKTAAEILEERRFIDEIDPEDSPFPTDADILEESFIDEIDPEDAPFPTDALVAEFSSFSTDALGAACRPKPSMVEKFSNNGDAATV